MKRFIIISTTILISLTKFLAPKAFANPPLKLEVDIEAKEWSLHDLPQSIFSLNLFNETIDEIDHIKTNLVTTLTQTAAKFIGRRYVWGSTGPKTFDCSGFTRYIFRAAGIKLNRTSRMQYTQGTNISTDQLSPGDLMFFSSPRSGKGRVGHVAMVVDVDPDTNTCTFVHAATSTGVAYQTFPDNGYYSKNFIGAKRIIDESTLTSSLTNQPA